jgi:arylsulfatase A-like enzyme
VGPLNLVDVAPTILDGMGVDDPSESLGRSFGPDLGLPA